MSSSEVHPSSLDRSPVPPVRTEPNVAQRGEQQQQKPAHSELPRPSGQAPTDPERLNRTLAEIEREHILAVLEANHWNRTRSAKILGIDVKTLYNKLKSYRVKQAGGEATS